MFIIIFKKIVFDIGQAGYNQLVEKVINNKDNIDADLATKALIIENFLQRSASQLTCHGLMELGSTMSADEVAVLFRNNHFSTIYKHKNELLQLVTDQGFLGEANYVWQTLSSIDGDGQFVDGHFRTICPQVESSSCATAEANVSGSSHVSMEQQIGQEYNKFHPSLSQFFLNIIIFSHKTK